MTFLISYLITVLLAAALLCYGIVNPERFGRPKGLPSSTAPTTRPRRSAPTPW